MISIAVIGANGQVGTEVCLLLSQIPGISVVPIVRSKLGAALLERCGLPCRVGALSSDDTAKKLLDGCDLIADFSLPSGLPVQVRQAIRTNVRLAIRNGRRGAPYVFMSSTMAFGSGTSGRYADLWLARTPYAASKRDGERWARLLGRIHRRPTYVFRLGQVFGELQAISRGLIDSATPKTLELADGSGGSSPSDAVFCSTIARALVNVASGCEAPGTFTLVETPAWTWRELYEFHARQAGVVPAFVDQPTAVSRTGLHSRLRAVAQRASAALAGQLAQHKDLLMAQLLPHYAPIELRLKARFALRRALAEIKLPEHRNVVQVACRRGPVPGKRLTSPTLPDQEVILVRQLLEKELGAQSHNYR